MNLANPSRTIDEITVTLMLEPQASGGYVAAVMEFPHCRVEAETKEAAIALIRGQWQAQIDRAEFLALSLPRPHQEHTESPWKKLFGLYKDVPAFDDVMAIIQAERDALGDEPIDPGFYLPREAES